MNPSAFKILLIEDSQTDALFLKTSLSNIAPNEFLINHVTDLKSSFILLHQDAFDAIILDLLLPQNQELQALKKIQKTFPNIPVVVLTGVKDDQLALQALREGAQDYFVKGEYLGERLVRGIRYAIERAQILETVRQQRRREQLLVEIARRIHASLELSVILETTVIEIRHFLGVDQAAIYKFSLSGYSHFIAESVVSNAPSLLHQSFNNCYFSPLLFLPIEADSKIALHDVKQVGLNLEDLRDFEQHQIRAVVLVPIVLEQELWGLLSVHQCFQARQWQEWEIDLLKQVTIQLAIAIHQAQLYQKLERFNEKLQRLVAIDGLTQIANRRQFDYYLQQQWKRSRREQSAISLIMCDVDHFKLYNDCYGHQQGDDCLCRVAKVMESSVQRPSDLVARYGGEEFAIILPNTNLQGALRVAHGIQQAVRNLEIPHLLSSVSRWVTMSLGVATLYPCGNALPEQLIQSADEAMYQAKELGRNCIAIAQSCPVQVTEQ
ncbi:diguanylate cyclase [Spirulina subsalsa FACHB-351]|uniref:Diguanylate cyclase n=1 Tax=Spirulina subsalsa FACHB-351 TaxID=234711 RepID=A0ABT3L4R8_9CYAN|nr:diguanylate cyclase [Spirulina subsalsa]MCW6036499.1 diguanylate cyclase [Spirulina subsalsa FACHB-351]